jgi:hypothetical protein
LKIHDIICPFSLFGSVDIVIGLLVFVGLVSHYIIRPIFTLYPGIIINRLTNPFYKDIFKNTRLSSISFGRYAICFLVQVPKENKASNNDPTP